MVWEEQFPSGREARKAEEERDLKEIVQAGGKKNIVREGKSSLAINMKIRFSTGYD